MIIYGGGIVEMSENRYFVRTQIAEYLGGFNNTYDTVTWIARMTAGHDYRTVLNGVCLEVVNPRCESIYSIRGLLGQLRSYLRFPGMLNADTDVIVSEYSVLSAGYVLLARLFARHCIFYLGSDPQLNRKLRSGTLYGRLSGFVNARVLPLTLKFADGALVRGEASLRQCARWNNHVILSKPLISYKHFRGILGQKEARRQTDTFTLLFVGKLEDNKGARVLIDAASNIYSTNGSTPRLKLEIVGSGPVEQDLRALAVQHGLSEVIRFHGFIDDAERLAAIFSRSDLLVVPTIYSEGFPRVIDEASACGLPVACSRLGGMQEGLDEDEVIFFTPGESGELAAAIQRLLQDSALRDSYRKASMARAAKLLDQTASEQHAEFLQTLNRKSA